MKSKIDLKGTALISPDDSYLFNEGRHHRLYNALGAHFVSAERAVEKADKKSPVSATVAGVRFAVWAPNAKAVSVIGDFNHWQAQEHKLSPQGNSGIWTGFFSNIAKGTCYKYAIQSHAGDRFLEKADPFAFRCELPPKTASMIWDLDYQWQDQKWMESRGRQAPKSSPMSIYEMHLGSWARENRDGARSLSYTELAKRLPGYLNELGFTHVEFLPVMEHPFYGSWGYQVTGYFAPSSRYGTPQEFMALVDALHNAGIGVILDWVPSHFPTDAHGLAEFDGTHLFEHADPKEGFHPDWKSAIFNYGRNEVRSFLVSAALFWLDKYHIDGLRVDAVASMLYRDYSRESGEWVPNRHGGRENLEAIDFLKQLNEAVYGDFPDTHTTAEESTAWPMVSRPTSSGGLGFGQKWDMGWMHDTLDYFQKDSLFRKFNHDRITFRMVYAFNENFVLPLSHDEVVHGKGSLLTKMPGDDWQSFANLRCLYSYMYAMPGKKLLFMGAELAQREEWNHESELNWALMESNSHLGIYKLIHDLNGLHKKIKAFHEIDFDPAGFEWIDNKDYENSVLCFVRKGLAAKEQVVCAFNLTPVPRSDYRIGVPASGYWQEIFNSDSSFYGGSGMGNLGGVESTRAEYHDRVDSISVVLPPLSCLFFRLADS